MCIRDRERIKENRNRWAEIEPFQRATYKPRQYRMQTRGQKLKKKGGLYGLYLYYCYRLGYLPKYKKQNNARLHYLLKDDLMKLDKITDEVRLLGRENISTDEQLFSYKTSLEEQMKNLVAGRTHLRKKIRTNIDDGQLQAAKDEIASINGELKKLRREVKLCEDIAERSKVMEEAVRNPMQKEERANANPSVAKTDKSPLSRQNSEPVETQSDKGVAKPVEKPSVKEKLDRYKAQAKQQKEAERKEPEIKKDGKKPQQKNGQTVHRQPKKKPKTKER